MNLWEIINLINIGIFAANVFYCTGRRFLQRKQEG